MQNHHHFLTLVAVFIILTVTMIACNGGAQKATSSAGEVRLDSCSLTDTTSFVKSNGERCAIYADATIVYPKSFGDHAATEQLQRLFAAFVLNAPDSLNLEDAMHATVSNTLHQYDFVQQLPNEVDANEEDEAQLVYKYNTLTTVRVCYNHNDVLTFCKNEVVKKNDKTTSETNRYYSFDLSTMSYIDLHKLFRDDALTDVTQLLRAQLLEQNNATTDDQLNDLGYFNVDNLTVTRNFCFGDEGVTWSFLPGQLAIDAVGEPMILLSYDKLAPLACDGSIISRFK